MSDLALLEMKLVLMLSSSLWITKGKKRDMNLSKMNKPTFPKLVFQNSKSIGLTNVLFFLWATVNSHEVI